MKKQKMGKQNKIYRILTTLVAICILFSPSMLFAQTDVDLPCNGNDPYSTCPLDSWVIVLAFAALVFAAWHLRRKQKQMPVLKG